MQNPTIFDDNHFRIYIPFVDYLRVEALLQEENINYYLDLEAPTAGSVRFYFDKKDESQVNDLLVKHQISATNDFRIPSDYQRSQKASLLYFKVLGVLLLIVLVYYLYIKVTKE